MKRVTEDFLEQCAILDLEGSTACVIDEHWEPLMFEEQMAQARVASAAEALRKRPDGPQAAQWRESMAEQQERADRLHAAQGRFRDEWARRGGWERVFLVLNHDGHYHRERTCSTCFATTAFGWVPKLSDKTEDEVIAEVGCMACTVCWPEAPRHPKFIAMEEAHKAQAAEKATQTCEGSGRAPVEGTFRPSYSTGYGRCPVCGSTESVTSGHAIRAHKTPLAKHLAERAKQKLTPAMRSRAVRIDAALDAAGGDATAAQAKTDNYDDRDVIRALATQRERAARKAATA